MSMARSSTTEPGWPNLLVANLSSFGQQLLNSTLSSSIVVSTNSFLPISTVITTFAYKGITDSLTTTIDPWISDMATFTTPSFTVNSDSKSSSESNSWTTFEHLLNSRLWGITIEKWLITLPLLVVMLFTMVGNILVVISIFTYNPLRNVQNMFLVSLAISDITVAVCVMPFSVAYYLIGKFRAPF